jgi:hypothetical protein
LNVSNVVAFIWGPIKFLLLVDFPISQKGSCSCLQTASTYTDSFETLLDAYEQLGEELPLLSEIESLFGENDHMTEALEWIYMDILNFHRHAMRFFQGKSK